MKKLLAIAVIFALVAGAVFAETAISGSVEARYRINGNSDGVPIRNTGRFESGSIQLSGTDDEGVFGGTFKLAWTEGFVVHNVTYDAGGPGVNVDRNYRAISALDRGFIWWQPIPELRIWMGRDGDGMFNTAGVTRWGFHQMDRGISIENWDASNFLLGNWDVPGIAFIITPIDGLAINAALGTEWNELIETTFSHRLQLQAAYSADFGTITATFQKRETTAGSGVDSSNVGLTFGSNSILDGLDFVLGFSYNMRDGNQEALRFAVGAEYRMDDFGVKFRMLMHPTQAFFWFYADIMPYYVIDGIGTILCNIRIEQRNDGIIGWHVNPYFRKRFGGSDLRIGARFENSGASGAPTNWLVGMTMVFAF